jgi:hypothetical protein
MSSVVALKMDLHCRRCVGRIRKFTRSLPGTVPKPIEERACVRVCLRAS